MLNVKREEILSALNEELAEVKKNLRDQLALADARQSSVGLGVGQLQLKLDELSQLKQAVEDDCE